MMLKKGDVFNADKGFTCYTRIPERFVYDNTPHSCRLTETEVTLGDDIKVPGRDQDLVEELTKLMKDYCSFDGVKVNKALMKKALSVPRKVSTTFSTGQLCGEYVVTQARMDGGGTGHGPGDKYPDGYHVVARKLNKDGKYNPNGKEINFYQSGCFSVVNEHVQVVRTMKELFK